jgi:hypothetical protein
MTTATKAKETVIALQPLSYEAQRAYCFASRWRYANRRNETKNQ